MTKLLLLGCGKMGEAMLAGWLAGGTRPADVVVIEPNPAQADVIAGRGVTVVGTSDAVPGDFSPDIVVLAVKPQVMDGAAPALARYAGTACYLSIAAGKTLANFAGYFGNGAAVVRAMPNTPAAVGRGITVGCPNAHVTPAMREICGRLLSAVGEVGWVDDEGLIDAVTGVSGSGPAYVFHLIEAMAAAGVAQGLDADLAMRLARATVSGAGELAHRSPESAEQLRKNVTSPNGTTQAALDVLMAEDGLKPLMAKAVAAATRRSRELAG